MSIPTRQIREVEHHFHGLSRIRVRESHSGWRARTSSLKDQHSEGYVSSPQPTGLRYPNHPPKGSAGIDATFTPCLLDLHNSPALHRQFVPPLAFPNLYPGATHYSPSRRHYSQTSSLLLSIGHTATKEEMR